MRVCPHCELPALDGSSFCPTCGRPLPAPSPASPPQTLMGTHRFPPAVPARKGQDSSPPPVVSPFGATMPVAVLAAPGAAPGAAPAPPKVTATPSTAASASAVERTGPSAASPLAAASASEAASQRADATTPPGATRPIVTNLGPAVKASPPRLASSAALAPPPFASAPMPPASSGAPPPPAPPPPGSPERIESSAITQASLAIPDPRHALLGLVIDGFSIDSILGSGGCGTVYRGHQLGLDRPVAIKVPTFDVVDDPVLKKRFLREARAAARVRHPSVVTIYGVGEVPDGRPYLAMELLDGVSLMQVLDDGPLEVDRALALARQIALALAETHAAGVVHRDLKPSNIIWRKDRSGGDRITIVDFGIAAGQQGSADATRLTAGGKVIGTPHYMAPEQAQGEHEDIDHRSDLYALGCVLFELLTAEVPFDGTGFEVVLAHMTRQPEPPSARLAGIPPEVDALVLQLMRKRPAERPASAEEVVARIDELRATLAARRSQASAVSGAGGREPASAPDFPGPTDGSSVGAASTMLAAGAVGPARGAHSLSQLERGSRPQLGALVPGGQHGSQPPAPQRAMGQHGSQPHQSPHVTTQSERGGQVGGQAAQAQARRPAHALSSAALARRRKRHTRLAMAAIAVCGVAALTGISLQRLLRDDGGRGASSPGAAPSPKPPAPQPERPPAPGDPPEEPSKPPSWDPREPRVVMIDSGELSMRMEMPGRLAVQQSAKVTLEIWDSEGQPLAVPKVLVTIEPPGGGQPIGFEAKLRKRGVYEFAQSFAAAGRNIVRVFPEGTDATFEVDLDVVEGG